MVMVRKLMTVKNFKPASLKQRISFLAKQIKTKKTLIQKLIDQKHELRQSYIVSMEKMRQNIVQKHSGNHSIQDDYHFEIVRLDKEEQVLTLEVDELLNQRDRLNKSLLDQNTGLFISKPTCATWRRFVRNMVPRCSSRPGPGVQISRKTTPDSIFISEGSVR